MAIAFNGATKVITLSAGTTSLNVRALWARWIDWLLTGDNSKYDLAMEQVGGNVIDAASGTSLPIYVYLQNGWRVKPQEANHTLAVSGGVLLVAGGGDPFANTTGAFMVRVNYQQPVQTIVVTSAGGGGATSGDVADAVRVELAPELTAITGIKAKTDNLPADPAREATALAAKQAADLSVATNFV